MVHSKTPARIASSSQSDIGASMFSTASMPGDIRNDVVVGLTGAENDMKVPAVPSTSSSTSTAGNNLNSCSVMLAGDAAVYGQLVILGYNGSLPAQEKRRRRSKFTLSRRPVPNGLKKSKTTLVNMKTPNVVESPAVADRGVHSISYTLNRNQAVVVEYVHDEKTDLFQVGRSSEKPIDFVVMDTAGASTGPQPINGASQPVSVASSGQSTISRFACRLLVTRRDPDETEKPVVVRLFAAGFNSESNIFLGEKATKWEENNNMDGLTTNGVLLMHPEGEFDGGNAKFGTWREVSVDGNVFSLREARSSSRRGEEQKGESNVLRDGSLIDLCGATLLWRSADGLKKSPTRRHLEWMVEKINAGKPQCPVGLNTLVLPRSNHSVTQDQKHMYVYLSCGHVQGQHEWGVVEGAANERQCPMCFVVGPVSKLEMGLEPAFYVDYEPPTYAFNPCGHMASEKTVKYWAFVPFPHGPSGYRTMCPFCATSLEGYPGFTKLIFQDNID